MFWAKSSKKIFIFAVLTSVLTLGIAFGPLPTASASPSYVICGKTIHSQFPTGWRAEVLKEAGKYCYSRYAYGGMSRNGIDCSGLVLKAYAAAGVKLPHRADTQIRMSTPLRWGDWPDKSKENRGIPQPGDVVAFSSDRGNFFHHIAIYLGGGMIIHAANSRDDVKVEHIRYSQMERWGRLKK